MGIENLLSRLSGVKAGNAVGRWSARCPAHDDHSPSLSIRLEDTGVILLKCWTGCEPGSILDAIGLKFTELFPESLTREFLPRVHMPFSPMDALKCLAAESSIVAIAVSDIVGGKRLDDQDLDRVATAAGRIATALEVVHG